MITYTCCNHDNPYMFLENYIYIVAYIYIYTYTYIYLFNALDMREHGNLRGKIWCSRHVHRFASCSPGDWHTQRMGCKENPFGQGNRICTKNSFVYGLLGMYMYIYTYTYIYIYIYIHMCILFLCRIMIQIINKICDWCTIVQCPHL